MGRRRAFNEGVADFLLDTSYWPLPNWEALSDANQKLFLKRYKAVKDYVGGEKLLAVSKKHKIDTKTISRLVRRCLSYDENNQILGFHGCIPHKRVSKFSRTADINGLTTNRGLSGAFQKLLQLYPVLDDHIKFLLFKQKKRNHIHQSRISFDDLHTSFLNECRKLSLHTKNQYPFNTRSLAYKAVYRYAKQLLSENVREASEYYGDRYKNKLNVGSGENRPQFDVLDRVELDAHKINAIFCILVPSPFGNIVPYVVERIWVVAAIDVATKTILGHHVSLRKEINKDDVLRCIYKAFTRWSKIESDFLEYKKDAGFPSTLGDVYFGLKWKELSVDGAMANLAHKVKRKLDLLLDLEPTVLKRRNKDDRPFIERFFGTLEERGFQKLPSTTGISKDDPLRNMPEIKACKYFIQLEEIVALTDNLMANYNATPHSSIGKRTPLEFFKYRVDAKAGELESIDTKLIKPLLHETRTVTVKGNQQRGERPYINFEYTKYSSPLLRANYSLCGQKIDISFDVDDLRTVTAYLSDGTIIGTLTPSPPWHLYPHSIYVKRAIYSLISKKIFKLGSGTNPIEKFLKYHEDQISKKRPVTSEYLLARQDFTKAKTETVKPDSKAATRGSNSKKSPKLPQTTEQHSNVVILPKRRMAKC